jgi:pimeloyl-ACP methyl ester carboxylesterase
MAERMIEADGVELCTEAFGDPGDPAILLVMGMGGSMLGWEEPFCRMLGDRGRYVIRYDHRDTGRSVTYPPGRPGYAASDLVADAVGVLDAHAIARAHVVGVSMGGALAQLIALDFADRVSALTLISTSLAVRGDRGLPGSTDELRGFFASARVDWADQDSVVEYLVAYSGVLAGTERRFDERAARDLVHRDAERARDFPAAQNHGALPDEEVPHASLSSIATPTLVIHGTADPMFPLEHGRALAESIPCAGLLTLPGAGHGLDRADWETVADAIAGQAGG